MVQPQQTLQSLMGSDPQFRILTALAENSSVIVQSQQRGEPELSKELKIEVLSEVLNSKTCLFLERWGRYLNDDELQLIGTASNDLQVTGLIQQFRSRASSRDNVVRNRRYLAVQKMLIEGTYFEDVAMKAREPVLFDQYVGRYMNEDDRHRHVKQKEKEYPRGGGFASFLMQEMGRTESDREQRRPANTSEQMQSDEQQIEEFDSESDSEADESRNTTQRTAHNIAAQDTLRSQNTTSSALRETQPSDDEDDVVDPNVGHIVDMSLLRDARTMDLEGRAASGLTREEKDELRSEFLRTMQERFIAGLDSDFDYRSVDDDDVLDLESKEYEQDMADAYFDE